MSSWDVNKSFEFAEMFDGTAAFLSDAFVSSDLWGTGGWRFVVCEHNAAISLASSRFAAALRARGPWQGQLPDSYRGSTDHAKIVLLPWFRA